MVKSKIKYIFLFVIGIFSIFLTLNYTYTKVYAEEDLCPDIDDDSPECLDYLKDKYNDLSDRNTEIADELEEEEYEQLSLSEKIEYLTDQISQSEKLIEAMEVEIDAKTVEIRLLEKEILSKEDSISIMKQEISILEESVNQRIEESYKYSFIGTLEIFLNGGDLDTILRKTKYLIATREKDKEALSGMNDKVGELKAEELELASEKESLEQKKVELEDEKTDLVAEKKELDGQKAKKDVLLAQSKAREAELSAEYANNVKTISDLDAAIIAYIAEHGDEARSYGHVVAGDWIGGMGNTGASSGAHLHFSIKSNYSGNPCSGDIKILSGYLIEGEASWKTGWDGWVWPVIHAGSLPLPIAGPYVVMSQDYHQGYAIDLISYRYWGDIYGNYGAPVYAVMEGELFKDTDGNGGVYAYIRHSNGWTTCYLHLQN